jgi:hypothetical protein
VNHAHFHRLTDRELHRVARDSTDPLVLELIRRLDRRCDAVRELKDELESQEPRTTVCPECGAEHI